MHNAQCTIIGAIGYWRLNVYNLFVYLKYLKLTNLIQQFKFNTTLQILLFAFLIVNCALFFAFFTRKAEHSQNFSFSLNHAKNSRCHTIAFCGLKTQCVSVGKTNNRLSTPSIWAVLYAAIPCEYGTRKSCSP